MTYRPQPIDTSGVELSSDIEALTEQLAEHAHEVWGQQRIADGWSYGATRDDSAKTNPCLVPYDQLPDSEKQYDRNAALETLKVIQALGYQIVSPEHTSGDQTSDLVCQVLARKEPQVADLLPLWQQRDEQLSAWKQPDTYIRLARHLIDLGVPYSAQEVAETGIGLATGQTRLQLLHLKGLALARSGAVDEAASILSVESLGDFPRDEEIRGLEAKVQKILGLQARSEEIRVQHLRQSRDLYHAAWTAKGGTFWTGINVASLHLLLGERDAAADVARKIEAACLADDELNHSKADDDPYWRWVTLGEAYLNQGKLTKAEEWYRRAAAEDISQNRIGHLNATRGQLKYLLEAIGEDVALVDEWLPIPDVVVFTGHRMNLDNQHPTRLPLALEPQIKSAIQQWLKDHKVKAGVSSAANGADILFLEALQDLKDSDSRIVLPFPEEEFIEASVRDGADESWVTRFENVVKKASRVTIASSDRIGKGALPFEYANRIVFGQGLMLAQEYQTSLRGLAVWNGRTGNGPGGTAETIDRWRQHDLTVYTIDVSDAVTSATSTNPLPIQCGGPECKLPPVSQEPAVEATSLLAMLFADAVGFSKLTDSEVELFIHHFLGRVAGCIARYAPDIQVQSNLWHKSVIPVRETWGDGLYFAFSDVQTAGCFALDLCDEIRNTRWKEELGFSRDLQIRIALHCGPAHLSTDPITGLPKCTGTHVSRAARLEPKTPPNHVYASDAFASFVAQNHVSEFTCEFVKLLDWAKHYGTYPTYVVRRKPGNS